MTDKLDWLLRILFAVCVLAIIGLSLRPKSVVESALSEERSSIPYILAEIVEHSPHAVAYAILVISGALVFGVSRNLLILGAVLTFLGLFLEGLQIWVPGRNPAIDDIIANICGVMIGGAIVMYVSPKLTKLFKKTH